MAAVAVGQLLGPLIKQAAPVKVRYGVYLALVEVLVGASNLARVRQVRLPQPLHLLLHLHPYQLLNRHQTAAVAITIVKPNRVVCRVVRPVTGQ